MRGAMSDLLKKPFGTHGKVHEITPQSAGWRYVGFSLYNGIRLELCYLDLEQR